jgi:hypothetical protein
MSRKPILAIWGVVLAFCLAPAAAALAARAPKVTVRIEGKSHTLLPATYVQTHTGWLTKGGAPKGACSATSAAGALDVATHKSWSGTFSTSFDDYFVKSILGELDNGPSYYWNIWVDYRYATTGACEIKLHRGDQLLFAAATYPEYPLELRAPREAVVGRSFKATVVWFNSSGVAAPLAGARITGAGTAVLTDSHGAARINAHRAGTMVLNATHAGAYVRAAAVRLHVSHR